MPEPIVPVTPPASTNKSRLIAIACVLLLVAVVAVALVAKYTTKPTTKPQGTAIILPAAQVGIQATGFTPATIKIKKGQAVTWINQDTKPHQIESDPYPTAAALPGFKAEVPSQKGESYGYTFDKSGTFTYHDRLDPMKLKGIVIVE